MDVVPAVLSAVVTTAVSRHENPNDEAREEAETPMSAAKRAAQLAAHPVYELFARVDAGVWHDAAQTPVVAGLAITGGLVYVGERLLARQAESNDACLIQPSLPVEFPESPEKYDDPEPDYALMTPGQRGSYLKWLANGRHSAIDLSYVMLYFYGLERRLLIDGPAERFHSAARQAIVNEIQRLGRIFGDLGAFGIIARNLTSLVWILNNNPNFIERLPNDIDVESPHSISIFKWNLARCAIQHKPANAGIMLAWYRNHPKYGLSADVRRQYDALVQNFASRFEQKFGKGIEVRPGAEPLVLYYQAANPQSGELYFAFPGIYDAFNETGALDAIKPLVCECIQLLHPRHSDETDASDIPETAADSKPEQADPQVLPNDACPSEATCSDVPTDTEIEARQSPKFDGSEDMVSFLKEVAEQPQWQRLNFFACALKHNLMADWCIRDINEWAAAHDIPAPFKDGDQVIVDQARLNDIL